MASDTVASTHKELKERKIPKVVDHLEVHPNMEAGHNVHTVHSHSFDHPDVIKKFKGPHAKVSIPAGHILHHIGKQIGVDMSDVGAGEGSEAIEASPKQDAET